jgi:hypothetical protein
MDGSVGIPDMDEAMVMVPAPKVHVGGRISAINDYLRYDPLQPITAINQPRLYVTEGCGNLIWCMCEYIESDNLRAATKDPIDCLGMLLVTRPDWINPKSPRSVPGGKPY